MVACGPRDLKKAVYRSYEKKALSSEIENVHQRLKNLSDPISKLLDIVDLEASGKTLDLGTGWGVIAIAAVRRFGDESFVVGLDFSPACLTLAKGAIKELGLSSNINLILGDAENLPFKSSIFNIILSQATINLIPNKLKSLLESARVLRRKGVLAFSDAIKEEEIDEESVNLWCQCITGALTLAGCKRIMNSCGLTLEEIIDLTATVRELVKAGKWPWPEFLEHKLKYLVLKARKK